ncbi:ribonuclease J [Pseudobutyrivibrio sp. NOR37]|uniref:MBL fold metallo-hydrolase n=1 Tax=Pseudobutyrivibrio xylanivorans TaxID=185007 RepID=A0A6M0LGU4_PSEXY|nr:MULTISPECIES: MBL fold metallo-hydrolase [Pseudobutyrivibrio]NEX01775.1 MBL fold metallo-hydrolase [Pseudobutyrivibrio xylanivorans]SFR71621.1 ribonuclease J [Pseudobutyrivibrio sp. NOR37]
MGMDESIRVKLHRGANQIGGVCTEICTDTTRLLFDVGSPLEDEGEQELLEIEGVTTGPMDCDGIFLTHYHGDHIGEIDYVDANIPVYMEKYAKKILEVQQEHMKSLGSAVWADSVNEISVGKTIKIKDLQVTPLASDHSAANSVMYLIEGCGKRILLTGDYRLHGFYKEKLETQLKGLGLIDLMITEGTTITRCEEPNIKKLDEEWVAEQFEKIFEEYKYVFLLTSSSQLDRIAAFSRCVPYGKYMITDKYQQALIKIYDQERESSLKSRKVLYYDDNLKESIETSGFGMVVRANDFFMPIVDYYFKKHLFETKLIYSMWSGYRDKTMIKKMISYAKGKECTVHVSGHVTKEDLEYVVNSVKPKKLIIHHSSYKKQGAYLDIMPEIENIEISDKNYIVL